MISRFVVFAFDVMDAGGGWSDYVSSHATLEEAVIAARAQNASRDVAEIIDLHTGEDVTPWRTSRLD